MKRLQNVRFQDPDETRCGWVMRRRLGACSYSQVVVFLPAESRRDRCLSLLRARRELRSAMATQRAALQDQMRGVAW